MLDVLLAAAIASENCDTFEKADKYLKSLGEEMVAIGKTDKGFVVIYSAEQGGTWTIVTIDSEAKTCIIADGVGMRAAPKRPSA